MKHDILIVDEEFVIYEHDVCNELKNVKMKVVEACAPR
jgi:hypothetical protein